MGAVLAQGVLAMVITRIEWVGVRVPFRRPLVTAQIRAAYRWGLLVLLHADGGVVGLGEASPVGAGSEAEVRKLGSHLARAGASLLGVPLAEAVEAMGRLPLRGSTGSPRAEEAALCFGLETAAYDALGKQNGQPVAALLGGRARPVAVNALIGVDSHREAARLAAEAVSQGFSSVKVKLGAATPKDDEALVRAVREAVGPEMKVRGDANEAWSVEMAIGAIARLERYGLEYVEQPVIAADVAGLAEVRRAVRVPIAADEGPGGLDDARRLLDADAADVLIVKPARAGGLQRAREIMGLARQHGVTAVVTSSLETGVGVAAALHLAATGPAEAPASGLATALLLEHDLLTEPLVPVAGVLTVSDAPGLGVELDMAAVRRYGMGVEGVMGG